ncbi:haloacid dehalogenase-like hydrolase (HAD) superfamily protein isoform X1 [Tasmannia lanceolata]|uniref:haloacid dehalogenase-like hydrolase (HAD) superfamily protein isoform X1 n=1 Tax=Tasmannia lanceolata TaxID=3420 RepID=UPI004062CF8A
METSLCSILHTLCLSKPMKAHLPKPFLPSDFSLSSFCYPRNFSFSSKNLKYSRIISSNSLSHDSNSSQELGVLLEVEGVLVDVFRLGNRQAFNVAFQKLGLDCANWTDPIYLDLARKAGGDEEKMLILFFNRIGWPTSLPTSEKENFMKSVLREKRNALDEFVMTQSLPLRPGVENFIDDALNDDVPLIILTAYSKYGDKIARSASVLLTSHPKVYYVGLEFARSVIENLGHERISKIKIVGKAEMEGSFYGQLVLGEGVSSGLDEQLVKEANKAASVEKQRIAKEVASMLKLSVEIDTSPTESLEKIVATLRAGAEYAGMPVESCVLIAGSQSGLVGAERIGMPCVVLRSSFTSRAEFPSANAVMDGFGGADLTISKLRHKRWS